MHDFDGPRKEIVRDNIYIRELTSACLAISNPNEKRPGGLKEEELKAISLMRQGTLAAYPRVGQ